MPQKLRELAKSGDVDGFESRCLELLEADNLPLGELANGFRELIKGGKGERVAPLAQMVFENADVERDPRGALQTAVAAFESAPNSAELRQATVDLYRRVYGAEPSFEAILESSGLTTGRPPRAALRVLDFCLALKEGDTLISRVDDHVTEVTEVDRERGLFTLRRGSRATTLPAREVVREFDRIEPSDFRVLRQLRPEKLAELVSDDPVRVVVGLIHAHGGMVDADQLHHELVPQHVAAKDWSKWWTKARTKLKRDPHVVMEGRSPIVLTYSDEAVTLEDEIWEAVEQQKEPVDWLATTEGYLRECRSRGGKADQTLLGRIAGRFADHVELTRPRRPAEALAAALALGRLGEQGAAVSEPAAGAARDILNGAANPAELIAAQTDDHLWKRALEELPEARPDDWPRQVTRLLPVAPATQLDTLAAMAEDAESRDATQQLIDDALADPVDYPEVIYWLWKGPKHTKELRLPSDAELFTLLIDTMAALETTLTPAPEVGRNFRNRVKQALALKSYAKAVACINEVSEAAAVTLRRQLDRLEGIGVNAREKLLDTLRDKHPRLWITKVRHLEPWEDTQTIWATAEGIRRRTAERDELVNVKMPENAKRIGEAASHGDLSENSEYKFALEERDFLRARLADVNRDLSLVRPLNPQDVITDRVVIGTRVRLENLTEGGQRVMTILGPFETDVEGGVYNYRAPVCQNIMGKKIGEHVTLTIDGVDQEFELASIEAAI